MANLFPKNLQYIREKNNLKQEEMAYTLHLKRSTYANYENGRTQPKFETLELIVLKFGINLGNLLFSDLEKDKVTFLNSDRKIQKKDKLIDKPMDKPIAESGPETEDIQSLLELLQGKDITIQSQSKTIATLEAFNEHLKAQLSALTGQLERLKKEVPSVNKGMEDTHKPSGKKRSA